MPVGTYERKTYEVVCSSCNLVYTVKQRKGTICAKCQKKQNDKAYYERNKDRIKSNVSKYKKEHPEVEKQSYQRNKEKRSLTSQIYYQQNKEYILKREEQRRRERGERPNGLSGTEKIALEILKELFPNRAILERDRTTLKNPLSKAFLELDFYLPEIKLAIELNGPTHYLPIYGQAKFRRQKKNDAIKKLLCKKLGIRLVEIPLTDGVHYDRFDSEHTKLKNIIRRRINNGKESIKEENT